MWCMPREHGEGGEFVETVTLADVLGVFDAVRGPVVFSADVADQLDCSRETARRKLEELHDRGDVERRKVARRVVYWRPTDDQDHTPARKTRDAPVTGLDQPSDRSLGDTQATDETADTRARGDHEHTLDDVGFPGNRDRDACERAVYAARDYIREHGGATKQDLVKAVMPEYTLGYDVDAALAKIEAGDRFRGAWWRRVIKPGLKALPDVQTPPQGASTWRYTGGTDGEQDVGVYDPTDEFDT